MENTKTTIMIRCSLFTALIAVGAFIQVPVPYLDYFTLQFLFVILSGMILGSKYGAISVIIYVLMGLMGIPIFAAGGGIQYIFRPSFGYLLGFIAAAFTVGIVAKNIKANKFSKYLIAAFSGFIVTYTIGIFYKFIILNLYLGTPTTLWVILLSCFPLDIPGDILLCVIGALLASKVNSILGVKYDKYR